MPLPNVVNVRSQTLLKECLGCQDLGETIGGEEFKSRGGGRGKPPVRSSVLGVQKTVWPSTPQTGVAILETAA